jgi:hypothetical protein
MRASEKQADTQSEIPARSDSVDPAQSSEEAPGASVPALPDEPRISLILPMGDARLAFPSDWRVGLQEGLDEWKQIISDAVRIDVCNMDDAEATLTDEQFHAVITTLNDASMTTYESVGNPMTGGSVHVVAYDASETKIWHIAYDGAWLIVDRGQGYAEIYNGEDPALMNLQNIF